MIVKKLRLQQCWSQEQLSQFSGLSVRTIQRIERGQQASLESLKSLAAVFEVHLNDLQAEQNMQTQHEKNSKKTIHLELEEQKAMEYVEGIKSFYQHLFTYIVVISSLVALNFFITPGYFWVIWCASGWGIGLTVHGIQVFEVFSLFSPQWEKKQIEKRLGREL